MKKSILFIINPISGIYRKARVPRLIEEMFPKSEYDWLINFTEYRGHAIELAKKAADDGCDIVVAVGGDGSINEIANGIAGTDTALGILPLGSGNGLARHLAIPLMVRGALEVIKDGYIDKIDMGVANGRYFHSNAGIGLVSSVAEQFSKHKLRGLTSYAFAALKHYLPFKAQKVVLEVDGEKIERRTMFVVVSNSNQLGYNFSLALDADLKDGQLDVVILNAVNKLTGFYYVFLSLIWRVDLAKKVEFYRAKEVKIHHQEGALIQLDGDHHQWVGDLNIHIEPGILKVVVPKEFGL